MGFQEMIISEASMARLNMCNVLCHFSHSGVDDMSDNQCHFGQNNWFADSGLEEDQLPTKLLFPADVHQMHKVVDAIFWEQASASSTARVQSCRRCSARTASPSLGRGTPSSGGRTTWSAARASLATGTWCRIVTRFIVRSMR